MYQYSAAYTEIMSGKSKKQSRKKLDRPFDPEILRKARTIADKYQIILNFSDGEYFGRALEMPFVMNDGKTPDACVEATRDILTSAIAVMLEDGQTPPAPASDAERTEQNNIRVTSEEKFMLEEAARSRGFRGISDFVRSTTLNSLR